MFDIKEKNLKNYFNNLNACNNFFIFSLLNPFVPSLIFNYTIPKEYSGKSIKISDLELLLHLFLLKLK